MIVKKSEELKTPCEKTSLEEGFKVIDLLEEILSKESGIGLAANQIGINKQVCIVRVPKDNQTFGYNFINPQIVSKEDPIIFENEGCLSFPNSFIKTVRYNKVFVKDDLEPNGRCFEGLEAVCVTHEVEHLLGITMYENTPKSIGPNGKCKCNSGKKFKKCCLPVLKKKGLL